MINLKNKSFGTLITACLVISSQAMTVFTFDAEVTTASAAGMSEGISSGTIITGTVSYSAETSDIETTEISNTSSAGIWAFGQVGPGSGQHTITISLSAAGQTWSINSDVDTGGFASGIVNVDNGDGNQPFGSVPAIIGDEIILGAGTRTAGNFPGLSISGADLVGVVSLNLIDELAPFDFITDHTMVPTFLPSDLTGFGSVSVDDELNFTREELFSFDITSISSAPEPSSAFFVGLAIAGYSQRRRRS